MKLLLSPHCDDEALFAAFTIQRNPGIHVIIVFDSYVQVNRGHKSCNWYARRQESLQALRELGVYSDHVHFLGHRDDIDYDYVEFTSRLTNLGGVMPATSTERDPITDVWLPLNEKHGHKQHNLVSIAATIVFSAPGTNIHYYATYTTSGKSTTGTAVNATGAMIRYKLLALTHYRTQIEIDALGCWPHFLRDQSEYIVDGAADGAVEGGGRD